MSQIKGSEYKEMVKKIFSESRNNGIEIKSKFKNEIDPIVQSSTKFDTKQPQMSQRIINYMEYASPKKERLHKIVNFQKSTIFDENAEPTRIRPQKKQIELYIEDTDSKPRKKKISHLASTNPITFNEEVKEESTKKAKNNRNRPPDCNGLLQLPDNKQKYVIEDHYNPSLNKSQIFTEGNQKKAHHPNLNKTFQYLYDKYLPYKTDHIVDIFNSKTNEKTPEQKITPKPNADSYSTFVNEARGICYERYHDYL